MTKRRRTLWIVGGALVASVAAAVLILGDHRPEGLLLASDEVGAAREHLDVRERLAALGGQIEGGGTPAELPALEAQRAALRAHARMSMFSDLSIEDLRRAVRAADDGYFADDPNEVRARGVYGVDDRLDHGDVTKLLNEERGEEREFLTQALDVARGVGAWMHAGSIEADGDVQRLNKPVTLGAFWKLCSGERFAEQPRAAVGTAFLVRPDVVVTAAHNLELAPLRKLVLVFDFEVHEGKTNGAMRRVYHPRRVLAQDAGDGTYDWAIVRLDRAVEGGRVLPIARAAPRKHDPVYMWGHSQGTPKKFMRGEITLYKRRSATIRVELDAFGGDSGSPVLNEDHEVIGVLYGGSADLMKARGRSCRVAANVRRGAVGEYVTKVDDFVSRIPR